MSQVKISGNASGTGVLTIAAPNTNTDRTLSLPDNTGSIITTASTVTPKVPLLIAYKDDAQQSIANQTFTKVTFNAEEIDTDGWFASSTYTPQQAGYYSVTPHIYFQFLQNQGAIVAVYKNGAIESRVQQVAIPNALHDVIVSGNCLIHCNGSTDYIEIYVWQSYGSSRNIYNGGRVFTNVEIFLARAD